MMGAVLASALFGVDSADAADLPAAMPVKAPAVVPAAADDWQFQLTVYGWLTGLNGDAGVRGLPPASVNVSASDALKNLDGALMGSFSAKKGDWTFLFDLIYTDVSDSVTFGPLAGSTADLGLKQTIVQGLAGYRLPLALPETVDLSGTVGFRYQHLSGDVDVTNAYVPFTISGDGTQDWIDPTVGLLLNYRINDKWFINALGDVGGFGVSSKLTAQGFAALGYLWTPQVSTAVGYRIIYTDHEDNGFVYDMTQQGLFVSLAYHF